MKYAIFLDIDNTLLTRDGCPQINKDALCAAQELGNQVFINTGRALGSIPWAKLEGIHFDGIVGALGGTIIYGDQTIRQRLVDAKTICDLSYYFEKRNTRVIWEYLTGMFRYGSENGNDGSYQTFSSPEEMEEFAKGFDISKVSIMRPITKEEEEFLLPLKAYIHDHYSETHFPDCNKAEAMLELASIAGFTQEQCIAMGDSSNDIEMLLAAGHSVVVGDGIEEAKQVAEYVACKAKEGAVADGLAHFIPELAQFAHHE